MDTWNDEKAERLVAAALSLTEDDVRRLELGGIVTIAVPRCMELKWVFSLDEEGVVTVSRKRVYSG